MRLKPRYDSRNNRCLFFLVRLWRSPARELQSLKTPSNPIRAQNKRDKDAGARDQKSHGAGLDQFFQIRLDPDFKHQDDDADLRQLRDKFRLAGIDQIEQTGADEQSRDDLSDDLRRFKLSGEHAEKFGGKQDNGKIFQHFV